jgi:hypothetical protein
MATAEQYRAKAAEYKELLDKPNSPDDAREFRGLEQTYATLADNAEWMTRNADKVELNNVASVEAYEIAPAPEKIHDEPVLAAQAILVTEEDGRVLQRLGAAVMMRWSTLPTELKRELFDLASSPDNSGPDGSGGGLRHTAELKGQIARFLHGHNGAHGCEAARTPKALKRDLSRV